MANQSIHIDLNKLSELSFLGIRRAYIFMAFGLAAAARPDFDQFHLPGIVQLGIVPQEIPPKQHQEIKREFSSWIVGNGLRELLEGMTHFLDELYASCLIVEVRSLAIDNSRLVGFRNKGVAGKFRVLTRELSWESKLFAHFHALTLARNCLTHRRGIVSTVDCNEGAELALTWRSFDFFIEPDDGSEKVAIKHDELEPIYVEKGGMMAVQVGERRKTFSVGKRINISGYDLREICVTAQMATQELHDKFVAFAKSHDVRVADTNTGRPAPRT